MLIWLMAAILCGATVLLLAAGSARLARRDTAPGSEAHLAVYRDQLAEIEKDLARGVLAPAEAGQQRTEVSRRLLAAAKDGEVVAQPQNATVAWLAALLVPVVALVLYLNFGAPRLPDMPQAERLARAEQTGDLEALVYKVERHLAQQPDDSTGWELLVPVYQSLNRQAELAVAYQNLIRIKGATAVLQGGLAEALTVGNGGLMTPEAAAAARAALALDGKDSRARYFNALGLAQEGKGEDALAQFRSLLADAPADAPWRKSVAQQISELETAKGSVPPPSQDAAKAVLDQAPDDQQAMIRGMVDGLAEKLEQNPQDLEGWLRLIRARTVLKDIEVAQAALDKARGIFAGNPPAMVSLNSLATELNLK